MLTDFNLIHLDHRRGPDSRVNEMYAINKMEFDKVTGMSVPELKDYVERELCIAPGVDPDLRRRLRRKRELINWITARRPLHLMNRDFESPAVQRFGGAVSHDVSGTRASVNTQSQSGLRLHVGSGEAAS